MMSRYGSQLLSSLMGVPGKHQTNPSCPFPLMRKDISICSVHICIPMAKTTPDNLVSVERSILVILAHVLAALHYLEANPPANHA